MYMEKNNPMYDHLSTMRVQHNWGLSVGVVSYYTDPTVQVGGEDREKGADKGSSVRGID